MGWDSDRDGIGVDWQMICPTDTWSEIFCNNMIDRCI